MSFLDNLESSLKNLESREERDPNEGRKRSDERARAISSGPWAQQLKTSQFTRTLLDQAAAAGHKIRAKVYMAWFDTTLRLEARQHTLELKPTPDGIVAEYLNLDGSPVSKRVDLDGTPDQLLKDWFASIPEPAPVAPVEDHDNE
jgi:hypothetical protein